jgi:CheY-like chemotaxis protein
MILVVDDEPALVEVISSVLEDEGHEVTTAPDGAAALAILLSGVRPCLTILDLMMPRMSGWELRERMLAEPELASIPVAIASAYATGELDTLQPAAVIHKPFQLEDLIELAARHCGSETSA